MAVFHYHPHLALALTFAISACTALPTVRPRSDSLPQDDLDADLKRQNAILVVHAVCGALAFQVFAPIAVVIASIGRSWGEIWFKLHYRLQLFVFAIGLGASATTYDTKNLMDKHKVLGFVLIGITILQVIVGAWAHLAQKIKREKAKGDETLVNKRRTANWVHIVLGLGILSAGGLQVTWGLAEWDRLVGTVPSLASIPIFIVTPFVLIRGALRMRRGQTFAQAFFDRPPTPTTQYVPPRKLFLGSSSYRTLAQNEDKDEEHESLVAREIGWVGPTTREEYETSLRSRDSTTHTFTSDGCLFDAVSEDQASISQPPTVVPSPSIYPPSPSVGTPYIRPEIPTSSMSPLSLPILTPPPPPSTAAVSPRLAFMPFSGSTAVHDRTSTHEAVSSPLTPQSSAPPSIRSDIANIHEVVVVPTPSPASTLESPRPVSVSTSAAAICDGDVHTLEPSRPPIARHSSMTGVIVSKDSATDPSLEATVEVEEEEEEDDTGDAESTRLMDELERELSVVSSNVVAEFRIDSMKKETSTARLKEEI
ncbi:cytochrome b561 domain-containing protein [Sporobolomyces salmoneus]|uniref:cytochrome b561 domain-containing protein n=1 Tax=Sporobolomyces salmoneus TaxID=183962 RepID=UPI0031756FBE